MRSFFGRLVRSYREKTGEGVREFARAREVDAGRLSGLENNSRPIMSDLALIDEFGRAIGVPDEDRQLFRDASRLSRGELPPDIADQEGAEEYILPAIEQARKARGE